MEIEIRRSDSQPRDGYPEKWDLFVGEERIVQEESIEFVEAVMDYVLAPADREDDRDQEAVRIGEEILEEFPEFK